MAAKILSLALVALLTACGGGETDAEFCARWRAANPVGSGGFNIGAALTISQEPPECAGR